MKEDRSEAKDTRGYGTKELREIKNRKGCEGKGKQ